MLAEDGIEAKVINIHTIKPIDSDLLVEAAKETGIVISHAYDLMNRLLQK